MCDLTEFFVSKFCHSIFDKCTFEKSLKYYIDLSVIYFHVLIITFIFYVHFSLHVKLIKIVVRSARVELYQIKLGLGEYR